MPSTKYWHSVLDLLCLPNNSYISLFLFDQLIYSLYFLSQLQDFFPKCWKQMMPFSFVRCWRGGFIPCVKFHIFELYMLSDYIISQYYKMLLQVYMVPRTCSEVAEGSRTRGSTFLKLFLSTVDWSLQFLSECWWGKDKTAGLSSAHTYYRRGVHTTSKCICSIWTNVASSHLEKWNTV